MQKRHHLRRCVLLACGVLAALAAPATAQAAIAVEGGIFASNRSTSAAGGVSLGILALPALPVRFDLTFAAAGNGAGSAGTVDVRVGGGTTIGAGIGVGNFGATALTSVIYDALIAQSIAPHTSLEARMYLGPQRTSSLFAGLRFSF